MALKIEGLNPLSGTIAVSGAKNATLPILCATILSSEQLTLLNVPNLTDVQNVIHILHSMGVETSFNEEENKLEINPINLFNGTIDPMLAGKLRASFLIAGSLLGKYGKVRFPLPGGCAIGQRPIDLHLKAFQSLGASWKIEHGHVLIEGPLKAGTIFLDFPSVGATENAILAAVSIEGETTILNAAEEPEIVDLVNFLNQMGADVRKEAGKTWVINGGKPLKSTTYSIMPDRIEAGTWLTLSALTNGNVKVRGIEKTSINNVFHKLIELGFQINEQNGVYSVNPISPSRAMSFQTGPHPSFPTDMQPQFLVLAALTKGMHIAVETVFENRFQHVPELMKMGTNIKVFENKIAAIYGGKSLTGAPVKATDLRAGAALILAGLMAKGTTTITDEYHIERGYENVLSKLQSIGANISKI